MKRVLIFILLMINFVYAFEELNSQNFEEKIKGKNVIIDFYAPWCPPCKILAQSLEDFDTVKPENVEIFKVNIDDEMTLAEKYGVKSLPTLLFFKDGKIVNKYVGVLNSNEILEATSSDFN